jgi:Fe-S cluster assembly ATP-binding protein
MKSTYLSVQHIDAFVKEKQILFDVSCLFSKGKVAVVMGPNGSGKSTLAHVLMGNPIYQWHVNKESLQTEKLSKKTSGIYLGDVDITNISTEERARRGLFLSFQSPVAIPGVTVIELLRSAYTHASKEHVRNFSKLHKKIDQAAELLHINSNLLKRSVHEGFSGGEQKKIELLQALVIEPKFAIFDEIDTGVDVDALKLIAQAIKKLQMQGTGIILITHTKRITQYLDPDQVLVFSKGKIIRIGDKSLIDVIEDKGFSFI